MSSSCSLSFLLLGQLLTPALFVWPWWFWRALAKYSVDCPSAGVWLGFFLRWDWNYGFGVDRPENGLTFHSSFHWGESPLLSGFVRSFSPGCPPWLSPRLYLLISKPAAATVGLRSSGWGRCAVAGSSHLPGCWLSLWFWPLLSS